MSLLVVSAPQLALLSALSYYFLALLFLSTLTLPLFFPLSVVGVLARPLSPPLLFLFLCGGIKGCFCWPSLFISGVLLNVFALFPVRVHLNALVRALSTGPTQNGNEGSL